MSAVDALVLYVPLNETLMFVLMQQTHFSHLMFKKSLNDL